MTEADCTKVKELNTALKTILLQQMPEPGIKSCAISGLKFVRYDAVHGSKCSFERPLASVIIQGRKRAVIGTREYYICENQSVVAGVDMPSLSCIMDSSPEKPFLSLFFYLDRQILADLITEMDSETRPPYTGGPGVSVMDTEPEFLESILRLVTLLEKPQHIAVRAPIIMRELHCLLLIGPQGGILHGLHTRGTRNNQLIEAISLLKRNIAAPLRVDDLARRVNMSVSSLHRHFKNITGFSPLQYHKRLRLYEAQRLMLTENVRAADAAVSVGYESVTQFNREYKRMFGEPPYRDINRRRGYPG